MSLRNNLERLVEGRTAENLTLDLVVLDEAHEPGTKLASVDRVHPHLILRRVELRHAKVDAKSVDANLVVGSLSREDVREGVQRRVLQCREPERGRGSVVRQTARDDRVSGAL